MHIATTITQWLINTLYFHNNNVIKYVHTSCYNIRIAAYYYILCSAKM